MGGDSLSICLPQPDGGPTPCAASNGAGQQIEPGDGAAWQFQYTLPGVDGLEATVSSRGHCREPARSQRMVDLFRLFDTFARTWMSVPAAHARAGRSGGIDYLRPRSPTARRPAVHRPPMSHAVLERRFVMVLSRRFGSKSRAALSRHDCFRPRGNLSLPRQSGGLRVRRPESNSLRRQIPGSSRHTDKAWRSS